MQTPWGPLGELDLTVLAERIVCADKHRLVEGLIVECLFDQIFTKIPEAGEVTALDVETVVVDPGKGRPWLVFIWARSIPESGLGRYLEALGKQFVPYLLSYDKSQGFLAKKIAGRRPAGDAVPLAELMKQLSGTTPKPFLVDSSVREETRVRQAFWGSISSHYGSRIGDRVVLPRLLINWGIQPYFTRVWNLDRVFVRGNDIWLLEVKHKFPIDLPPKDSYPTLRFGINTGELEVIGRLEQAGIHCLHTILVKPVWSPDVGAAELLADLNMRARMALIGVRLDRNVLALLNRQEARRAASHTTINGSSGVDYRTLPATRFSSLGQLVDRPEEIAVRLLDMMSGRPRPAVRESQLRDLRVTPGTSARR